MRISTKSTELWVLVNKLRARLPNALEHEQAIQQVEAYMRGSNAGIGLGYVRKSISFVG